MTARRYAGPKDRHKHVRENSLQVSPAIRQAETDRALTHVMGDDADRMLQLQSISWCLERSVSMPNTKAWLEVLREWLLKNKSSRLPGPFAAKLKGWQRMLTICQRRKTLPLYDKSAVAVVAARRYLLEGGREEKQRARLAPWMNDTGLLPKRPPTPRSEE